MYSICLQNEKYVHFLASGRVVSGSVTIVLGGFTMAYDIYKLSSQIETLATKSTEGSAEELRQIAQKLEEAVEALVNTDDKTEVDDFKDVSDANASEISNEIVDE